MNKSEAIEKLKQLFSQDQLNEKINNLLNKILPLNEYSSRYNLSIESYISYKFYNYIFIEADINKAKQYLYLFGRCVEISTLIFDQQDSLELWVRNTVYLLLSDNLELIQRFGHLKDSNYDERLSQGDLVPCIQAVIREDWDFLKRQIKICRSVHTNKPSGKWMIPDLNALEGIMEGDKQKIEKAIDILATKDHKKRNDESIWKELLSIPAIGYAKLAWLKGIEVETNSDLIPKELLPIKSNESYWEYDYMKSDEFKC